MPATTATGGPIVRNQPAQKQPVTEGIKGRWTSGTDDFVPDWNNKASENPSEPIKTAKPEPVKVET